jgi:peptidoglycan/LPS O-acetylase OafA/YrhL
MNDPQWWRDLLERLIRNLLQALTPALTILASTGGMPDFATIFMMAFAVVVLTLLKYVSALTADDGDAWYWRVLDRAASAGAGGALALIPAEWTGGFGGVDWAAVGAATLGSALLALVMLYGTPPSMSVDRATRMLDDDEPDHRA